MDSEFDVMLTSESGSPDIIALSLGECEMTTSYSSESMTEESEYIQKKTTKGEAFFSLQN